MGESHRVYDTFQMPFSQRPMVILGAGIIGCAAARQLLHAGFSVVLVAEYLPGDQNIYYASAWAGAAWHAAGGLTPDQRYFQAVTHRMLLQMAHDGPESGVSIVDAREYLEQEPTPDSAIWGKTVVSKVGVSRWPAARPYRADVLPIVSRVEPRGISLQFPQCLGLRDTRDGPDAASAISAQTDHKSWRSIHPEARGVFAGAIRHVSRVAGLHQR